MWDKINFLEANPEEYNKIRNELFTLLDDKYFNSDFVLDEVEKVLDNKA